MAAGSKYPAKVRAKVRAAYEAGEGSARALSKAHSVPEPTIRFWMKQDKWKKGKLKKVIEKKIADKNISVAAKLGITPERVLKELGLLAFSKLSDYIEVADGGEITVKQFEEMPADGPRVIKKIKENRVIKENADGQSTTVYDKIEIDLYDKLTALDKLGKHLGLFTDNGAGDKPPEPPKEIEVIIRHATERR